MDGQRSVEGFFIDHPMLSLASGATLTIGLVAGDWFTSVATPGRDDLTVDGIATVALALGAAQVALFAGILTSVSIIFGLAEGRRLQAILKKHGKRLVGLIGVDLVALIGLFLLSAVSALTPTLELRFVLAGAALATCAVALHFGLVMRLVVGFALDDLAG